MGLNFQKELYLVSQQIYPPTEKSKEPSKLQERLMKKLGPNAFPFTFTIQPSCPASVILQQSLEEAGDPCGVSYFVKVNSKEKTETLLEIFNSYLLIFVFQLRLSVENRKLIAHIVAVP